MTWKQGRQAIRECPQQAHDGIRDLLAYVVTTASGAVCEEECAVMSTEQDLVGMPRLIDTDVADIPDSTADEFVGAELIGHGTVQGQCRT